MPDDECADAAVCADGVLMGRKPSMMCIPSFPGRRMTGDDSVAAMDGRGSEPEPAIPAKAKANVRRTCTPHPGNVNLHFRPVFWLAIILLRAFPCV